MDCEVVCYLVPRASAAGSFSALAQMHDPDARLLKATEQSTRLTKEVDSDDAG